MLKSQKIHTRSGRIFGQIMGINVISTHLNELLVGVEKNISDSSEFGGRSSKFSILTPNSELVLMAQKDKKLADALNSADFPVPDTVGLNYASKYLFGRSLNIIPGRKLFLELIDLADKNNWRVFLLGGLGDEAKTASAKLQITYPKLQIQFFKGPKFDNNAVPVEKFGRKLEGEAIERINKFSPQLLFVALGNPKQEIWIHKNLSKLKIGGAMAVGGTFRYIAGLSAIPPRWMEKAGLEWLWRLINEPRRIGRVINAVVVFPIRVFFYKIFG
ncbi:MAG: WecB/TagA/CpsF family glycosyltransferase [Candidatus Microgenomates bacterium]|jgi:N-acetylglucosaminyldiphosphoundecaprenol N-acetyl-beta-D-mannosaminyltransferase